MIRTVLVLVIDNNKNSILMIEKLRGQGKGKMNFPGGKLQESESSLEAAIRECGEETGIIPKDLKLIGKLEFLFEKESGDWDNFCEVFSTTSYSGKLLDVSAESKNSWVPLDQIPFESMWPADRMWFQDFSVGQIFGYSIKFTRDHQIDQIKKI